MNVLILGNLGPYPTRIAALVKEGLKLTYVPTLSWSTFDAVRDFAECICLLPSDWGSALPRLVQARRIDVVYSLLNSSDKSIEATIALLDSHPHVPVVRHYKEHPCIPTADEKRSLTETSAQIYINEESYQYFRRIYDVNEATAFICDADMIPLKYMKQTFSSKQRHIDGFPHLVIAGSVGAFRGRYDMREFCNEMSARRVHIHLYMKPIGRTADASIVAPHADTRRVYEELDAVSPFIHLHHPIHPDEFTQEWSCYDAGVMHVRVDRDDVACAFQQLNYGHRYSGYLAAGLPLVVQQGGQDAMERFVHEHGLGIVFSTYDELAERLWDEDTMSTLTKYVRKVRIKYSFDTHATKLAQILCGQVTC